MKADKFIEGMDIFTGKLLKEKLQCVMTFTLAIATKTLALILDTFCLSRYLGHVSCDVCYFSVQSMLSTSSGNLEASQYCSKRLHKKGKSKKCSVGENIKDQHLFLQKILRMYKEEK